MSQTVGDAGDARREKTLTIRRHASAGAPLSEEITEADQRTYEKLVCSKLTDEQVQRILTPPRVYPAQETAIAVHWHPEFVPMELIHGRVDATFPGKQDELIIPTNHNVINSYDGVFCGVEIDCYARSFKRKVQFLVHFHISKLEQATVLKQMLKHTFNYRTGQLWEFIDTILDDRYEDRMREAADETGADQEVIDFVRAGTRKLRVLIDRNEATTPREMLRNKIVPRWFDAMRGDQADRRVDRAKHLLKVVKEIVKRQFTLEYFYEAQEIIEECRALGAGIVIPHPEQFWPVLLADYDVDGYEVWNPQSREYTGFLIDTVRRHNKARGASDRPLLIFMGDDCHMGEKAPDPRNQDKEKAAREVGVQPGWEDIEIRKSLIVANCDRQTVINEYRNRLLS